MGIKAELHWEAEDVCGIARTHRALRRMMNLKTRLVTLRMSFMFYPELEKRLQASKLAVNRATRETIIEQCKAHLGMLAEYRSRLYELEVPGRGQQSVSALLTQEGLVRKAIRDAIENTTRERNRIQVLLLSFTTLSGYEAVEIFNERKYQGHDDWELHAGGVRFRGANNSDLMTIREAVDLASLLRRDDYVAQNASSTV